MADELTIPKPASPQPIRKVRAKIKRLDLEVGMLKEEERQCTGTNRAGQPCKKAPIRGGFVCMTHGGAAPQVRAKANLRLLALVEPSMVRLHELILQDDHKPTALGAIRTVLERAGDAAQAIGPLAKEASEKDKRPVIMIGIKVGGIEKPVISVGMGAPTEPDTEPDILEGELVGNDEDGDGDGEG